MTVKLKRKSESEGTFIKKAGEKERERQREREGERERGRERGEGGSLGSPSMRGSAATE